eukprot:UN03871
MRLVPPLPQPHSPKRKHFQKYLSELEAFSRMVHQNLFCNQTRQFSATVFFE